MLRCSGCLGLFNIRRQDCLHVDLVRLATAPFAVNFLGSVRMGPAASCSHAETGFRASPVCGALGVTSHRIAGTTAYDTFGLLPRL